jgi:hypothetical protein
VRAEPDVAHGVAEPVGLLDPAHRLGARSWIQPVEEEDPVEVVGLVLQIGSPCMSIPSATTRAARGVSKLKSGIDRHPSGPQISSSESVSTGFTR